MQASLSDGSAGATQPSYDVDLICYGIGRFSTSLPSRLQLAVLLALHSTLPLKASSSLLLYDPLLSSLEAAVLRALGIELIEENEEAKRPVSRCTVFYMPHCGEALYNNMLWANWAWFHPSNEHKQQQPIPQQPNNIHEIKQRYEQLSADDQLSSVLSSMHLSSARSSAHLGHVILIGNQLSAYTEKRFFPTDPPAPHNRSNSRRTTQRPSHPSSRCPIHSALPTTHPSTPPPTACQYECVCLVDALRLLQCRSLESELRGSGDDMRLAFHDTAVQWFEWSEGSGGGERERVERWLQHPLAEPKRLADDGELVSCTGERPKLDDT